jgi:transcription initiation factor TFIIIB Brf1 subunit/transcription initiation factor TFIIB
MSLAALSCDSICHSCKQDTVVFDNIDVHGLVCSNCGTVVDDSIIADDVLEFNRDSRCPNGLLIEQVVGERGGVSISRPGSIPSRPRHFSIVHHDTNVQRDRRIMSATRRLDEQVRIVINSLRLPNHLFNGIKGLALRAIGPEITKQKKVDTIVAVCTYIICRQSNHPIQLLDAADVINMNVFKLGSQYKKISQILNIKLEVQDPAILAEKVIADLEEELANLDHIAKMKLMQRTTRLVHVACKEWLDTGRKPISIVAAAVKIVVLCDDINLNINQMAKRIGVGSLSIRDRHRELQNLLLKLSSSLPWAKEITKKTLAQYLPFILEYVESLRKLHRVPMKDIGDVKEEETESDPTSSPLPSTDKELPLRLVPPSEANIDDLEGVPSPTTSSRENMKPLLVSRKRKTRGSQQKSVDMILGQITEIVPPSFVRSQLERQTRIRKIIRAKKRMQNEKDEEPIDEEDVSIEKLIKAGVSEQAIEDGYYHIAVQITNKDNLDNEELVEEDLQEGELEKYIKSVEQVNKEEILRSMLGDDVDGETTKRRAKKKQRLTL